MYFESIQANYEGLSMLAETTLLESTCMQLFSETQMLCDELGDDDYVLVSESDSGENKKGFFGRMFDSIKNFLKKIKDFIMKIIRSVLSVVLKPFGVKWAFLEGDKFAGGVKAEGGGGGGGGSSSSSSSSSSKSPTVDVTMENIPGFDSVDVTVANVTSMVVKYGEAVAKARQGLADDGVGIANSGAYKAYVNSYQLSKGSKDFLDEFKDLKTGDVSGKSKKLVNWINLLETSVVAECKSIREILVYELDKSKKSHLAMDKDTNAAYTNMFMSNSLTDPASVFNLSAINVKDDICAFVNTARVHTHDGDKVGIMMLGGDKYTVKDSAIMATGGLVLNGVMGSIERYIDVQTSKVNVKDVAGTTNIAYQMENTYRDVNGKRLIDAKIVNSMEGGTLVRKLMSGAGTKLDGSDSKFTTSTSETKMAIRGLKGLMENSKKENTHSAKDLINDSNLISKLNKEISRSLGFTLHMDVFDTGKDFYPYIEYIKDLAANVEAQDTIGIYNEYNDMLKKLEDTRETFSDKDKDGKDKDTTLDEHAKSSNTPDEVRKKIADELKGELADLKLLANGTIGAFKDAVKIITIVQVNAIQAIMTMRLFSLDSKLALAYHALGALSEAAKAGNTGSGEVNIKEASAKLVKIINTVSNALKVTQPK